MLTKSMNSKNKRLFSMTETILSTYGFFFLFLSLYFLANLLLFLTGVVQQWDRLPATSLRRYLTSIARGFGMVVNLNASLVILVSSRSLILFLRDTPLNMLLPFDEAMPAFHAVLGIAILSSGILHSFAHWTLYLNYDLWSSGFNGGTSVFVTGVALAVVVTLVRVSTYEYIRRHHFEIFYYVHTLCSYLFYVLMFIHGTRSGRAESWKWIVAPLSLYLLDRVSRYARKHRFYLLLSKHSAIFQGNDLLCLRLPRVFHFQAGQHAELKLPALSRFQWHPFTIASAPHEPEMVFYVKACGDWTCALYQMFNERIEGTNDDVEVHIRGPFGSPAQHVGQFEHVVLIGSGIGAVPFCSVTKAAHYWIKNWITRSPNPAKTKSVCGDRSSEMRPPWFSRKRYSRSSRSACRSTLIGDTGSSSIVEGITLRNLGEASETQANLDPVNRKPHNKSVNWQDQRSSEVSTSNDGDEAVGSEVLAAAAEVMASIARDSSSSLLGGSSIYKFSRSKGTGTTASETTFHTARTSFATVPATDLPSCRRRLEGKKTDWSQVRPSRRPSRISFTWDKFDIECQRTRTTRSSTQDQSLRTPLHTILDIETEAASYSELSRESKGSLEHVGAVSTANEEQNQSEVYKKSLAMLIGIRYGSAALVRSMQVRNSQKSVIACEPEEDLTMFRSKFFLLLLFMHSITVNMFIVWLLMLRIAMAGFTASFGFLSIFENGLGLYKSRAVLSVDLAIISVISLFVAIPALLEAVQLGRIPHHGVDLFVLTPTALFGVVTDILSLAGVGDRVALFGLFNILIIWPMLTTLLCVRLMRVIGERVSLADNFRNLCAKTKSLDFIWTASGPEDDTWLVKELLFCGEENIIRLHRYLMRAEPREEDWMQPYDRLPVRTYYDRPDWDEVFTTTAEKSLNGSTIGVFFCGPKKMGKRVQKATFNAMRNSILRGLHAGGYAHNGIEEIFGNAQTSTTVGGHLVHKSSGVRGTNIRFIFKIEKFA